MHVEVHDYVERVVDAYGPFDRVVECGSLNVNGGVRDLFPGAEFTGVDRVAGPDVDVVTDFADYRRMPDADLVVCCEVLEHAPDRSGIVEAAHGCLAPGGLLLVTCATTGRAAHGVAGGEVGAEWYANVAPTLLPQLFALCRFTLLELELHLDRGDLYALARRN